LLSIEDLEVRDLIGAHRVVLRRHHDPALAVQAALEGAVVDGEELAFQHGDRDEGEGRRVQRGFQGSGPGVRHQREALGRRAADGFPAGPKLAEQAQERKEPDGVGAHE